MHLVGLGLGCRVCRGNFILFSGNQLAIDVCILLIEVYISTYQLSLAASHMDFVEAKLFADGSRENGELSPEDVEKYRSR